MRVKGSTFFLKTKHKILKYLFLWKKIGHFRWFTELNSPQYSQHLLQIEIARIGNIAEGMGENSNETKSFHLDFIKQSFSHNLLYHFKAWKSMDILLHNEKSQGLYKKFGFTQAFILWLHELIFPKLIIWPRKKKKKLFSNGVLHFIFQKFHHGLNQPLT